MKLRFLGILVKQSMERTWEIWYDFCQTSALSIPGTQSAFNKDLLNELNTFVLVNCQVSDPSCLHVDSLI